MIIYMVLLFICEKEFENFFGDCNSVDGLNFGEIVMRGEGILVWFLEIVNGFMMFFVLSGGILNCIFEDIFLLRLDFCLD